MSRGKNNSDHGQSPAPDLETAITEAMIQDLVRAFYAQARQDPALGPIFDRAVRDWDAHLSKLCDFWSAVMLGTRRFKGAPVAVHAQLADIHADLFAQWLGLFRQTARQVCPPDAAALFIARSEIIAESLELGIAANRAACAPSPRRLAD